MTHPTPMIKQPSEARLYDIDFSPLMMTGDTLLSVASSVVTPVTVPPLVVDAGIVSGTIAQHRISGGRADTLYKISEKVATAQGDQLEDDIYIDVWEL